MGDCQSSEKKEVKIQSGANENYHSKEEKSYKAMFTMPDCLKKNRGSYEVYKIEWKWSYYVKEY